VREESAMPVSDYQKERVRRDALRKEFEESRGFRIHRDITAIQITFYAFQTNFEELDCLIRKHYKLCIEHKLGDFYNRVPLESLLIEMTRRLHNFVFAAKSLVEHTENFISRWYSENSAINAEYRAEVARRFGASGIGPFTSGLRNFFAHAFSPFLVSRMAGSHPAPDEPRYSLGLDTDDMHQQRKWTAGARMYISRHNDDVNLGLYVQEYYELMMRFYHWLGERNEQWCKADWEQTMSLQDQIQAYETKWGRPERPFTRVLG
jgi:hypothetical protein